MTATPLPAQPADPSRVRTEHALDTLSVIVVDWERPDLTIRCVQSLLGDGVPPERVVVVENGPTEATWAAVSAALTSSVLLRVSRNVGFARANNIGARALPGSAYLLVNNDAFVHRPGSVAKLLADLRPGVGIVAPRLLNEDGSLQPTVVPFTTPSVALVRASGLSRFVPNRSRPFWSTHWDHASSQEIEATIGAVMLVRGEVWDAVGGLSETSFMYAEDLDLCWRARRLGVTAWFDAEAEFVHVGGASSGTRWTGQERGQQVGQAEGEIIRRHLSPVRAALALAFVRAGLVARIACFSVLSRNEAADTCRGFLRGYGARPAPGDGEQPQPEPAVEIVQPKT
jgi:N-acetylglucosaminyl-diphospho-decaprenol L-rhamnosyltransferase